MLLVILELCFYCSVHAQKITGYWQSADAKRVYLLSLADGKLNGILAHSQLPEDSTGKKILLSLDSCRGKYKGWMASPADEDSIRTILRLKNPDTIQLRIYHMFFLPVTIYWHRLHSWGTEQTAAIKTERSIL